MTSSVESFAITAETAELYEAAFVPAFFAQWAPMLCATAGVGPGQDVLDVGCGTGIVARTAADLVGPSGHVVGLDPNEAMLAVARRVRPGLDWRTGRATDRQFAVESFDVVLSQMALMFFPDRAAAVAEMQRVVRVGGSVGVLVPGALDQQAAFAPFVELAGRHAGPEAMSLLSTYFVTGDLTDLAELLASVGLEVTTARLVDGRYRAPSVEAFVRTEVESTPLAERLSESVYARIRSEAHLALSPFVGSDGTVDAPFVANLVVARRGAGRRASPVSDLAEQP